MDLTRFLECSNDYCPELADSLEYLDNDVCISCLWDYRGTIPSVVDQREIQKIRLDFCRRHPQSCLIKIIVEVLDIVDSSVLDLTFGVGEFYRAWLPSYLVACDVVNWDRLGYDWVIIPDEFYEVPFWHLPKHLGDRKFDVVIFDPPYDVKPVSEVHEKKPWLRHGAENLGIMLEYFPKIAKKYAKKYVIAKFMDGKRYTIFDLVEKFKQKPTHIITYRYIHRHVPKTKHNKIIKTHTYYLIWRVNQ